jgi:hypothetical protein
MIPMSIPSIDPILKDWVQTFSWVIAILGGAVAAIRALYELRQNRYWKQTEAAKKLIDNIYADQPAQNAMEMLDWGNADFKDVDGNLFVINESDLVKALRITNLRFDDKEKFIRDCFDCFFYHIAILEHSIQRKLIQFADIRFPIDYYVNKMSQNPAVFRGFDLEYGYEKVVAFLERFPEWNRNKKKKATVAKNIDLNQLT